ncbi:MAG: endopeptidase La [Candidatus Babeliaceae bacterium]|nr:endopeptidase La [Candidatus Babeliaceae bacterium]
MTEKTEKKVHSLPLLPLKNIVLLPKSIVPLIIGRERSIQALKVALDGNRELCVAAQRDSLIEEVQPTDLFTVGARASILQVMQAPKGAVKVLLEGIGRVKILSSEDQNDLWLANIADLPTIEEENDIEAQALWRQVRSRYKQYVQISNEIPSTILAHVNNINNVSDAADTMAIHSGFSFQDRQALLESINLKERLHKLYGFIEREIDILKTETRIRDQVQSQVEKNQREYYLNEQIKAIHKELGRDDMHADLAALRERVILAHLPEAVAQKVEREIRRLEQMQPMSAESTVSRTYIDWILTLPWYQQAKDRISLKQAEAQLDRDHYGLAKVKERILEFIAAKKFNPDLKRSPILCLVGPPGVGKTSLARSIALALGREFVRISLGGTHDEAEIRGHRRTYIGAMPGKIIQGLSTVKTVNPVILLDEIDKLTNDTNGDPAAALLEALDPEQNKAFVDNFLEVGYDLSRVMFITTANHPEGIPYPLFDRMEIINLSGYTAEEKMNIAQQHLIPKILHEYGVHEKSFSLPKKILQLIINDYTKEAGVRQLEQKLAKMVRNVIRHILVPKKGKKCAASEAANAAPIAEHPLVKITEPQCHEWLGIPPFRMRQLEKTEIRVGRAVGLAWTEMGGDVLEVEALAMPGKGEMTITGQLGDVMRESAQAALSFVRSRSERMGLAKNIFKDNDFHLHVPEGATPKDGPSAGITMCSALVSVCTKIPLKTRVAMTGEITLSGRVLPIGGLKEKLIAAQQYGAKTVLVPLENREEGIKIVEEIDKKGNLKIIYVNTMDEVLENALEQNPFVRA